MTLRKDNGELSAATKLVMGIFSALFIAMACGAVWVPWSFLENRVAAGEGRVETVVTEVKELRERGAQRDIKLERIQSDIQYIRAGIDDLKRKP